jgi:pimeloyl-ACP methyl ester carboxylesterase
MFIVAKWLRRLAIYATLAVVLWLVGSYFMVYRFTQRPQPMFAEPAPEISWGEIQSLRLPTDDGEELGAWFIDGEAEQPLVLLLHGHRGCRRDCLAQAKMLAEAGCPVLLISLRAHGDSTGQVNDAGYSARHDVAAAVGWLRKNHPDRPVVVWGRSLGAAAAVFAAGQLSNGVTGYILECPYQDVYTAVWNRMEYYLPPVVRHLAYAGAVIVAPLVLPEADKISPLDAAASIPESSRVLIMAGSNDRRARPEEARAVFERVRSHARLVIVPQADHLRLHEADAGLYEESVLKVIGACR